MRSFWNTSAWNSLRSCSMAIFARSKRSYRFLALGVLAAMMAIGPSATVPVAGQTPSGATKAQSTPWGDPDLQGVWLSNSATPLERPKALEGRPLLTDAEVAELKKRADTIFKDGNSDYAAGDSAFLAALANVDQYKNPTKSTGSSGEMVERAFDNRTSLIVDPPDGKVPALTPEARKKQAAAQAASQRRPAGPEDFSNANRCITWGVPRLGGNFGAGP